MNPQRLQLRRTKGFRLSEASYSLNGRMVVKVDRTTKWGNWAVDVCEFRRDLEERGGHRSPAGGVITLEDVQRELRGKNLACWCEVGSQCHGDVLLELANREVVR